MPSKKPGHEVRRESALVAFGGMALLPLLDGHHGPGKPIDLIGDDGEVLFPHVPRHQQLELLGRYLPDVGGSTLHELIGEVVPGIQAIQLGGLYEAVHQGAGDLAPSKLPLVIQFLDPNFTTLHKRSLRKCQS